ncbi:MAG: helix-hairpin-helix domain-containing protein [bacterium]
MNNKQTVIAGFLIIVFVASIPAISLQFHSFKNNQSSTNSTSKQNTVDAATPSTSQTNQNSPANNSATTDSNQNTPRPSNLAKTHFSLERLSEQEIREAKRALRVDINQDPVSELTEVPYISKEIAQRIVNYRRRRGVFRNAMDLARIKGLGRGNIVKFLDKITLSGQLPQIDPERFKSEEESKTSSESSGLINVNTASSSELQKIDGVGPSTAQSIISYRDKHGGIKDLKDMQNVSGIGPATAEDMKGNVTF